MATYWVGDLQGCNASLGYLLDQLGFSASRDRLVVLGDLINRGPDNAGVLDRLIALSDSATCLLGNHDLFVLAAYHGVKKLKRSDTARLLFDLPQAPAWMDWLAHRDMARFESGCLLVHAGVLPGWDLTQTLQCAREVETALRGPLRPELLHQMFGHEPLGWRDDLGQPERWRVTVNALTRLRFCSAQGEMEFATKEGPGSAPPGFMPWFDVPGRRTADTPVVFGHWSTVGGLCRPNLACLDTGCLWGRSLSALRVPANWDGAKPPDLSGWEWISVPADPADVIPLK
ncbi:MAG: symmetrical bis(5'-nucleosyl)-tetraphosphatase [Alphaproteobacteria bacterium]|nr:symmetrical bis(5'-nucleosyl)-tetraphosphatase [Alphaproteobacteria bacterium]